MKHCRCGRRVAAGWRCLACSAAYMRRYRAQQRARSATARGLEDWLRNIVRAA